MIAGHEDAGYVDPATCTSCHQDVAESFSHTGMANSIYKPDAARMAGDFTGSRPLFQQATGNYYIALRKPDGYYIRRYQLARDGSQTDIVEERIDYVIGSGDQARSYLHRNSEGHLIQLPISWYSEQGGYWAMTPGYDGHDQKDMHGIVSKECIFCHDAYPQREPAAIEASQEPVFTRDLPQGIDCQRCHGPGAQHERAVAAHPADEDLARNTIVNPGRLSRERQLDVCMECHLSTSASQDKNISLRPGRDVFSYRPGEPLGDYKLYFDTPAPPNKQSFPIADAAYRLRMSACFRSSQMTCLTCHDPHDQIHGSEATQHYIEACDGCHRSVKHAVALPAGENCLTCHMPKRRGETAIHTILTDHYIQRNRPPGNLLAPVSPRSQPQLVLGKLALYYPAAFTDQSASLDLDTAIVASQPDAESLNKLGQDIRRLSPAQASYYAALGEGYIATGEPQHAVAWLQTAVDRNPQSHDIAGELAEALLAAGDLAKAQQTLEGITATGLPNARLLTNLANIYARQGDLTKAEATLRRSLAIDPELAQTYNLMGSIKERAGDSASAETYYAEAVRYRPDFPEPRCNLAKLLIANNEYQEAEFHLTHALMSDPRYAEAHHTLALLMVLKHEPEKAEVEFRAAIADDSANALSASDFGDLLARTNRSAEAADQYRHALALQRELPEANLGLGQLLRRQGLLPEAQSYCSKALNDPSLHEDAIACLQR
jgi:Tfp pilus assembly protein PilF